MDNLLLLLILFLMLVVFLAAIGYVAWRSLQKKDQPKRAPSGQQRQKLSLPTHPPKRDPNYKPSQKLPDWPHSLETDSGQAELAEIQAKFGEVPDDPEEALAWLEALVDDQLDGS